MSDDRRGGHSIP